MAEPVIICPSEEELLKDSQRNIVCSEEGCKLRFATLPALWMHNAKTHRIYKDDWHKEAFYNNKGMRRGPPVTKQFLCPVEGCSRGKLFDRMVSLKVHYINIHAEKKFPCDKCGRKFGAIRQQELHKARCGQILKCSCGTPYTTPEALYMHAKRTNHELTEEFKNSRKYCWKRKDLEAECQGQPPPPQGPRTQPPALAPLLPRGRPVFILHQIVKQTAISEQTQTDRVLESNQQSKDNSATKRKKSRARKKAPSRKRKHASKKKSTGTKGSFSGTNQTQEGGSDSQGRLSDGQASCSLIDRKYSSILSQLLQDVSSRQNLRFPAITDTQGTLSANLNLNNKSVMSSLGGSFRELSASNAVVTRPPPTYMDAITSAASAPPRGQGTLSLNGSQQFTSLSNCGPDVGHTSPQALGCPSSLLSDSQHRITGDSGMVTTSSSGTTDATPDYPSLLGRNQSSSTTARLLSDMQMLGSPNRPGLHSLPEPSTDSNDSIGFRSIGTTLETLGVPTQTDFDFLDLLESCDIHTQTIESIFPTNPVLTETSATQTQALRRNMATNLPPTNEVGTFIGDVLGLSISQASIQTQTRQTLITNEAQTLPEDLLELSMNPGSLQTWTQQQTLSTNGAPTFVGDILELGMDQSSLHAQTQHTPLTNEVQTLVKNGLEIGPNEAPTQTQGQQMPFTNEAQTLVGDVVGLEMNDASMQTQTLPAEHSSMETQTRRTTLGLYMRTEELQTMTHSTIATSPFPNTPSPLQQESQETQTMANLHSHDLLSLDIYTQTGLGDWSGHPGLDDLEFSHIHTQTMDDFDLGVFDIDLTCASVQTDLPLASSDSGVTVGTQVQSKFLQSSMVSTNVQTDKSSGSAS